MGLADEVRLAGTLRAAVLIEQRLRRGALAYYLLQDPSGHLIAGNIAPVQPIPGLLDLSVQVDSGESGPTVTREAVGYGVLLSNGVFALAGENAGRIELAARAVRNAFIVGGGVSALLGIAGGLILSAGFIRRLETVNETARAIMAGQLDRRVPIAG